MIKLEPYTTGTKQKLLVHNKKDCSGHCCVHNPSNHHMKDWPTHWREDRGFFERIDSEGVGHPDPDDLNYKESNGIDIKMLSVHGCNGLCNEENYKNYLKEKRCLIY